MEVEKEEGVNPISSPTGSPSVVSLSFVSLTAEQEEAEEEEEEEEEKEE